MILKILEIMVLFKGNKLVLLNKRQGDQRKEAQSNYKYRLEKALIKANLNQSISQIKIPLQEIQGK